MKRISILLAATALFAIVPARAQDAATEERLNKLNGNIQDILAAQESLSKQMQSLSREVAELREKTATPAGNYADEAELKRLAEAVKEVDRKRVEDNEKIKADLKGIRDALLKSPIPAPHQKIATSSSQDSPTTVTSKGSDQGYEYVIQKGDTLSVIVQAYREKNIKVTSEQILKANPGLKAERMPVGKKIFIPAPPSLASSQ